MRQKAATNQQIEIEVLITALQNIPLPYETVGANTPQALGKLDDIINLLREEKYTQAYNELDVIGKAISSEFFYKKTRTEATTALEKNTSTAITQIPKINVKFKGKKTTENATNYSVAAQIAVTSLMVERISKNLIKTISSAEANVGELNM